MQADIGISYLSSASLFSGFTNYDIGLHVYRTFGKVKAGVFYSAEYVGPSGNVSYIGSTYGAEAVVDFGKLDVEASIAGIGGPLGGSGFLLGSVAGYYQIGDAFEVSLGIQSLMSTNTVLLNKRSAAVRGAPSLTTYSLGARLQFPNAPFSISASYATSGGGGQSSVSAFISYGFGAIGGTRAFQRRNLNYFERVFSSLADQVFSQSLNAAIIAPLAALALSIFPRLP